MKILTLNTWQEMGPWQDRWEVTFQGLKQFCPDIAGFQELFNPSWAREIRKRSGFKNIIFAHEKCGDVLYARYPVKSWDAVTLSKSPLEEYFRYVLWAELEVGGNSLFVFNTHLSWMLEDGVTRMKQIEEIIKLIDEKANQGEVLLMGDLNASPITAEIKSLIKKGNFRDLFEEKHPGETVYTWDNRSPYVAGCSHKLPDRRIDFILARGKGPLLKTLLSCDIVFNQPSPQGVWASDHYGVLAEFKNGG